MPQESVGFTGQMYQFTILKDNARLGWQNLRFTKWEKRSPKINTLEGHLSKLYSVGNLRLLILPCNGQHLVLRIYNMEVSQRRVLKPTTSLELPRGFSRTADKDDTVEPRL